MSTEEKTPIYYNSNDNKYYSDCTDGVMSSEVEDFDNDKYDNTAICKTLAGGRRRKSKKSKKAKKTKKSKKSKKTKKSRKH